MLSREQEFENRQLAGITPAPGTVSDTPYPLAGDTPHPGSAEERTALTIRLPDSLVADIETIAQARGVTLEAVIDEAFIEYLRTHLEKVNLDALQSIANPGYPTREGFPPPRKDGIPAFLLKGE